MSRVLCQQCQRPTKACICQFTVPITNTIPVVVLQHPNEVNHSKNTVALLTGSLAHCQVIVGEDFSDNQALTAILSQYNALLLYPSEQAQVLTLSETVNSQTTMPVGKPVTLSENSQQSKEMCLIIIDGTWKKAYRMLMLSKNLQSMVHVCLPEELANKGQYLIRKVAKANALSSLEACCYALAILESSVNVNDDIAKGVDTSEPALSSVHNSGLTENKDQNNSQTVDLRGYQDLLNKFAQFNQFQLSFRPK